MVQTRSTRSSTRNVMATSTSPPKRPNKSRKKAAPMAPAKKKQARKGVKRNFVGVATKLDATTTTTTMTITHPSTSEQTSRQKEARRLGAIKGGKANAANRTGLSLYNLYEIYVVLARNPNQKTVMITPLGGGPKYRLALDGQYTIAAEPHFELDPKFCIIFNGCPILPIDHPKYSVIVGEICRKTLVSSDWMDIDDDGLKKGLRTVILAELDTGSEELRLFFNNRSFWDIVSSIDRDPTYSFTINTSVVRSPQWPPAPQVAAAAAPAPPANLAEIRRLEDLVGSYIVASQRNLSAIVDNHADLQRTVAETNRKVGTLADNQAEMQAAAAETNRKVGTLADNQAEMQAAAAETNRKVGTLADNQAETNRKVGTLADNQAETNRKVGTLADNQAEMQRTVADMQHRQVGFQDDLTNRMENIEGRVDENLELLWATVKREQLYLQEPRTVFPEAAAPPAAAASSSALTPREHALAAAERRATEQDQPVDNKHLSKGKGGYAFGIHLTDGPQNLEGLDINNPGSLSCRFR